MRSAMSVASVQRPTMSLKQAEGLLGISSAVQIVLAVMYILFVIHPFYVNGLDRVPVADIESGLYEPDHLYPFCYTPAEVPPAEVPGGGSLHCADGTTGNPNGRRLLGWAVMLACLGPWVGGVFTILSTLTVLRYWDLLRQPSRVIGVINVVLGFGTFILMAHRGPWFLFWLFD
jgi:hypothetical protein